MTGPLGIVVHPYLLAVVEDHCQEKGYSSARTKRLLGYLLYREVREGERKVIHDFSRLRAEIVDRRFCTGIRRAARKQRAFMNDYVAAMEAGSDLSYLHSLLRLYESQISPFRGSTQDYTMVHIPPLKMVRS